MSSSSPTASLPTQAREQQNEQQQQILNGANSTPNPSSELFQTTTTLDHVQTVWTRLLTTSPVYAFFLPTIRLISASRNNLIAHLTLGAHHINSKHTLHGSVSATLVDWAGGLVLTTAEINESGRRLEATGLSTDLNVTFVSSAREGETVEIEAWVVKLGRNIGFTRVEIRKAETGEVVAYGNHTKYVKREQR